MASEDWNAYFGNTNQNYPWDKNVYNQFGGFGNGYVPLFVVVGKNKTVYYDQNSITPVQDAIRLAISEMPEPGTGSLSETSLSPQTAPDTSVADTFDVISSGTGDLPYYFEIDYTGSAASGSTWHMNDFNSGIGYTVQSGWAVYAGGTWNDGTQCANAADSSTPSVMTSASFNTTGVGDRLWLEFRYGMQYTTGSALIAEYYNGSAWVEVWRLEEGGIGTAKIELPVKSANTQLRFTGVSKRVQGTWSIERLDNIKVYSDDQAYRWLLFDQHNVWGEPTESGTVLTGTSQTKNLTFDATGLAEGTYNAVIKVVCTDPVNSPLILPVEFTVTSGGGPVTPAVPSNLTTSLSGTDLIIDWDDSADATYYNVYASSDPYGTFTFVESVTVSQYLWTPVDDKIFILVVAGNSTKESPRSITIKAK